MPALRAKRAQPYDGSKAIGLLTLVTSTTWPHATWMGAGGKTEVGRDGFSRSQTARMALEHGFGSDDRRSKHDLAARVECFDRIPSYQHLSRTRKSER